MSPHALATATGGGFESPTPADFWQPLVGDGNFAITRAMFMIIISVVVISAFFLVRTRKLSLVPNRMQFATESVYNLVRNSVAIDLMGSKAFRPFMPLLFTQFTLILVNNLFGVIPFIQFPTFSRIGFAIAITLVTYVVYHAIGFRRKGVAGYMGSLVPSGVPGWIAPFIWVLEAFTFFITRPLTLALRLFANMFAGHMLLLVFILGGEYMLFDGPNVFVQVASVGAFGMGIVMTFFEILVQFLQAYVFVLLTALYIAGNLADEH